MFHERIKKIPGILPKQKEGQLEDLHKYSNEQIKELIIRQEKIISNKSFILKLPDKGEKLLQTLSKLKKEFSGRRDLSELADSVTKLTIADKDAVERVEWSEKKASQKNNGEDTVNIKIDDECKDEKYVSELLSKVEKKTEKKEVLFKPYYTTKSDVHGVERQRLVLKGNNWEVTAATPPPLFHSDAKLLSLEESFTLQKQQATAIKAAQVIQASERLASQLGHNNLGNTVQLLPHCLDYREPAEDTDSSSDDGSDVEKQVLDEDEEREKDVAVIYSIVDA